MPFFELVKFRIKQAIVGEKPRGLLRFLAPDFLVGFFLGISSEAMPARYLPFRVALVTVAVALFTSLAETRKFFFSGGDIEQFYFVQPTASARLSSVSGLIVLNVATAAAIFIPAAIASPFALIYPVRMLGWLLLSVFAAVSLNFALLILLALLPRVAANRGLTLLQVLMALFLLAAFQLSVRIEVAIHFAWLMPTSVALFILTSVLFAVFPFSDSLVVKFSEDGSSSLADFFAVAERLKRPFFIRSAEEEAGFMFFLANLFRSSSFRLSTIGVAATPVMVALYWSMQRVRFMRFNLLPGLLDANLAAPLASIAVSGVLVFYFLSQGVLSSKEHDARWLFESRRELDAGRFVLGVRKGLLASVHLPVTLLVFLVSLFSNTLVVSAIAAVTYYSLVHVSASWFSIMQRRFPFSVPFTRLGVTETVNLIFMIAYSLLVAVVLFAAYGNVGKLLMVNLLAFILVGILESFSVGIVNKRVKLGV